MNSICISGNIATAPQFTEYENEVKRCSFSLANDRWYGGEKTTGFYWVTAWGRRAEAIRDYCQVGTAIFITGRLDQYRYEDESGEIHYENSIILDSFDLQPLELAPESNSEAVA